MKHLAEVELELYSLDRVPEQLVAQIEAHVFACAPCRARLAGWLDFALALKAELKANAAKPICKPTRSSLPPRHVRIPVSP